MPILSKGSKLRKPDELETLKKLLFRRDLFKDPRFNEGNLQMVAYHLIMEKYEPKQMIFDYGTRGDKFYIILQGKVSVWVPDKEALPS